MGGTIENAPKPHFSALPRHYFFSHFFEVFASDTNVNLVLSDRQWRNMDFWRKAFEVFKTQKERRIRTFLRRYRYC